MQMDVDSRTGRDEQMHASVQLRVPEPGAQAPSFLEWAQACERFNNLVERRDDPPICAARHRFRTNSVVVGRLREAARSAAVLIRGNPRLGVRSWHGPL